MYCIPFSMSRPNERAAGSSAQSASPFDPPPSPKPTTPKQAVISSIFAESSSPPAVDTQTPAIVKPTQPAVRPQPPPATQPVFQPMFIQHQQPQTMPAMMSAAPANMSNWNTEQVNNVLCVIIWLLQFFFITFSIFICLLYIDLCMCCSVVEIHVRIPRDCCDLDAVDLQYVGV